jgi:YbbR domain-containing protein
MEQIRMLIWEAAVVIGAVLRPAARSVRENSGLAVLSVVLAFGLWIFVTDAENPEQTERLGFAIPVRPVNVPPDIAVVARELKPVTLEVRVEQNVFDSLTKDDFQATVDLTGLTVGPYDLKVDVETLTQRGNLRVMEVLPPTIHVELSQLISKPVPVELETRNSLPSDFELSRTKLGVETAVVAGRQDRVAGVTKAVASVDVQGRTESFNTAVRLEARDQSGELFQDVEINPAVVDVSINIEQKSFSRALAVSPQLKGTPRDGYNVFGVSVEPAVVTVFGSQTFVEQAVAILTQPVDIDDATSAISRTVSLNLPPGTSVRGGANVTVKVNIIAATGQQAFAVPITVNGLADNVKIAGTLPPVQVFLFGPLTDLLKVDPSDIKASIDLDGKDAGTHKVSVRVTAPNGLESRSISPQEIDVTLEHK